MAVLGILISVFGVVAIFWLRDRRNIRSYQWLRIHWINRGLIVAATMIVAIGVAITISPVGWITATIVAVILAAALAFGLQQAGVRRGMIIVVVVIITALSLARYRPVSTSSHQEETVKFTPPFSLTEETDDFGKDKKMVLVLAGNNKGVDGPVIKSLIKKYPGYGIWFVGSAPDKTFVQFGDKKLPLDAKWGEQFGAPTFFGPEGETVEIILAPISR